VGPVPPAHLLVFAGSALGLAAIAFALARRARRREERLLREPMEQLIQALNLVRSGQASIDELNGVDGPLAEVARHVQDLLRELRRKDAEIANLAAEMRQRVAQRTDALERTLGAVREQSHRDSLTGLHNRRMYDEHLPVMVDQAQAACADLTVLMLDLDNFKCLNDSLGHQAGDEFLKAVGGLIRSSVRAGDVAFRCGGDEFVIALPGTTPADARELADRLTRLVDQLGQTQHTPKPVGSSAGVAGLSELTSRRVEDLLELADQRLYEAKERRRQTVCPRIARRAG
jgi:diguanylate cyclase (GGDEF)-like protein